MSRRGGSAGASAERQLVSSGSNDNPFALPKEDIFAIRDRELREKNAEKERQRGLKIWEKNPPKANKIIIRSSTLARSRMEIAPKTDSMFQGRRREKENIADFIAKKRDMFLIQMSLDTKRQEIQKLEEKAQMKEDALKKSEMMLEEDAMRFDAFLKDNDRKAHDALKRADAETKAKQEKVAEIKKLNQEIAKVEAEMSKYDEQLIACMKYKDFLDNLTPQEHIDAMKNKREKRKQDKLAKRREENPDAHIDLGDISSDGEDVDEMYFQEPSQLLDIFAQLEERNLFLIQNVQETEEGLEELRQKYDDTTMQMEEKTSQLQANISDLRAKINVETGKADNLRKRSKANTIAGNQQKLLQSLSEKVKEVYAKCISQTEADAQTDTLAMLRQIERWLEYLLSEIKVMDTDLVKEAEKKKEDDRRERVRRAKKLELQRQYEERLAKSTARAKAEVIRQTGKQVMFRSPPIRSKKKREVKVEKDDEAEEIKRYFTY